VGSIFKTVGAQGIRSPESPSSKYESNINVGLGKNGFEKNNSELLAHCQIICGMVGGLASELLKHEAATISRSKIKAFY
jgi:hypothetical protein